MSLAMDGSSQTTVEHHPHVRPKAERVRSRVGRRIVSLLIGGVLLCVLVVYLRDAAAIKSECRHLDLLMTPVRKHLVEYDRLPLAFPADLETNPTGEAIAFVDPKVIRYAQTTDEPTVIAYANGYGLILRSNGHAVAIYHNKSITIEWMSKQDIGPRLDAQRNKVGLPPRE